ncbi:MAG: alkaline phosphatase family protein [Firmicutes bacterium]|nr:alkaline phosphatase family protein [Bacillota bacterium]
MDRWLKYGGAVVILGIMTLLASSWNGIILASLERYQTPFSLSSYMVTARETVGEPQTERIIWVIADGLSPEAVGKLPFLSALSKEGAYRELTTGQPGFCKPSYATISSGAWPEVHGVLFDGYQGAMAVDNLFLRLKEAGLKTDAVAHRWWRELNGNYFSDKSLFYTAHESSNSLMDQRVYRQALDFVQNSDSHLLLVHFPKQSTVNNLDKFISGLAADIDFQQETLFITSSSSPTGTVPLIAAGKGISPGHYDPANQIDLATTIAGLSGITGPTEAQGRILWEMLTVPAQYRSRLERARTQVFAEFASAYVTKLGYSGLTRKNLSEAALILDESERLHRTAIYEGAFQAAQDAHRILSAALAQVREDKIWRGRWGRLPVVILLVALIAWAQSKPAFRHRLILFAAGLLYLLWYQLFFSGVFQNAFGPELLANLSESGFFRVFAVPAYLGVVLTLLLTGLLRRLCQAFPPLARPEEGYWEAFSDYLAAIMGIHLWLTLLAALGFLVHDTVVSWYVPDLKWITITLAVLQQIIYLAPVILVAPALPFGENYLFNLVVKSKTKQDMPETGYNR